jgi:beta-galactosidase
MNSISSSALVPQRHAHQLTPNFVFRAATSCVLRLCFGLLLLGALVSCSEDGEESGQPDRERIIQSLNENWQFAFSAPLDRTAIPSTKWQQISLPHTWNSSDGQDGGDDYRRAEGIYRRDLYLDKRHLGKRLFLHFDGAAINTSLYINGALAGTHKGSYGAFRFDISDMVTIGGSNRIEVHVSNLEDDTVAPLSADFTFFGGLYRNVRLIVTEPLHIDTMNHASSGVFWKQDHTRKPHADLTVSTTVVNQTTAEKAFLVRAQISDRGGALITTIERPFTVGANQSLPIELPLALNNPHLWQGKRDPYLYTAVVSVIEEETVVDKITEKLGLRYFRVDTNKGFYLNGEPFPLHGVNRMPDFLDKGTAVSEEDHERDLQLMIELGATSTRLGHQQRDPYVYRRADELGLVVWAELSLINRISDDPEFSENMRQQALEMVRQNYNRPSIVMWGLYNEITLQPGPDPRPLIEELNILIKAEDPDRLTTAAVAAHAQLNNSLATTPDLISFNRYDGWYYGELDSFGTFLERMRKDAPELRLGISEFGAGASTKIQTETPVMQDHSEQYQALYHESYWETLSQSPWVWGKYVWVLADFAVDNRNEGDTPGRNDKGLVSFDRKTKKDAFYWYQANWSDTPMVHITSKRHAQRNNNTVDIKVYSNLRWVELKVNGESMGAQLRGALPRFQWGAVPLSMGHNTIEAIAHSPEMPTKDEVILTRINSNDTRILSSLLGVDVEAGKIYNAPFGATLDSLSKVLTWPLESSVWVLKDGVDGKQDAVLKPGAKIRVTAQDGTTVQDYALQLSPISVAKSVTASAEIVSDLSIGSIDMPVMSARKANDGIVIKDSQGLMNVNMWNTMGGDKHWWKVDLGASYFIQSINIVWPQHSSMITSGPMAYRVETALSHAQTFDTFSESYTEQVDASANSLAGTTHDELDVEGQYLRVKLLKSGIFADNPTTGRSPVYGAEEITVIGGLLHSSEYSVDYQERSISIASPRPVSGVLKDLHPVSGGSLRFFSATGRRLGPQSVVKHGTVVIARDAGGLLAEKYTVH